MQTVDVIIVYLFLSLHTFLLSFIAVLDLSDDKSLMFAVNWMRMLDTVVKPQKVPSKCLHTVQ